MLGRCRMGLDEMLGILAHRTYRHLFLAQVVALVGTGLATVALGLLAFEIAGENAGAVLGTALAIKMIAYVVIAPMAGAIAEVVPRKGMLVALDIVRAAVALVLPFVTEVWQIYLLIFLLQSASAAFTPTFQATIPDVLPDEREYTRALSLSRLAYDLENLLSPMLAALLLLVLSYNELFFGTVVGFIASALLVVSVVLPRPAPKTPRGFFERTTRGLKAYLATPRLRGLLAISLAVSAAGSMVVVNTVVLVQGKLGLGQQQTAWALAAFGGGSMAAALLLPTVLDRVPDRRVMLSAASALPIALMALALQPNYPALLLLWLFTGIAYASAQTPAGRLLRRSSNDENRASLFAGHFAASHACWLISYPLAGWAGSAFGLVTAAWIMAAIAALGLLLAMFFWPSNDSEQVEHTHPDLAPDHPHWQEGLGPDRTAHRHALVIDDLHQKWPTGL